MADVNVGLLGRRNCSICVLGPLRFPISCDIRLGLHSNLFRFNLTLGLVFHCFASIDLLLLSNNFSWSCSLLFFFSLRLADAFGIAGKPYT